MQLFSNEMKFKSEMSLFTNSIFCSLSLSFYQVIQIGQIPQAAQQQQSGQSDPPQTQTQSRYTDDQQQTHIAQQQQQQSHHPNQPQPPHHLANPQTQTHLMHQQQQQQQQQQPQPGVSAQSGILNAQTLSSQQYAVEPKYIPGQQLIQMPYMMINPPANTVVPTQMAAQVRSLQQQPPAPYQKRERKPLPIVDPNNMQPVTPSTSSTNF